MLRPKQTGSTQIISQRTTQLIPTLRKLQDALQKKYYRRAVERRIISGVGFVGGILGVVGLCFTPAMPLVVVGTVLGGVGGVAGLVNQVADKSAYHKILTEVQNELDSYAELLLQHSKIGTSDVVIGDVITILAVFVNTTTLALTTKSGAKLIGQAALKYLKAAGIVGNLVSVAFNVWDFVQNGVVLEVNCKLPVTRKIDNIISELEMKVTSDGA